MAYKLKLENSRDSVSVINLGKKPRVTPGKQNLVLIKLENFFYRFNNFLFLISGIIIPKRYIHLTLSKNKKAFFI
jgi:hypothetical protein